MRKFNNVGEEPAPGDWIYQEDKEFGEVGCLVILCAGRKGCRLGLRRAQMNKKFGLGGSSMLPKARGVSVLRSTAYAAADSERCPASFAGRRAHPDGTRTVGQSLPSAPDAAQAGLWLPRTE